MKPSTSVLVDRSVVPSSHSVLAAPTVVGPVVGLRQRAGGLLVRDRHIRADIAALGKVVDEIREIFGRHGLAPVFGIETVLLDPIAVDQRRAGMLDWPADDAGGSCSFGFRGHDCSNTWGRVFIILMPATKAKNGN